MIFNFCKYCEYKNSERNCIASTCASRTAAFKKAEKEIMKVLIRVDHISIHGVL